MEIRECLSVYLESGYLFDDMSGRLKWFEIDKILISFTYGVVRYVGTWGGCRTEKKLDGKLFYSSEECFKKGESIPKTRLSIYDVFESLYGFIPIGDVWKYKNGRAVKGESEFYFVKEMKGGGTQIDSVVQNTMRYSYRKEGDLIPAYMSHELGEILPSMINVSKSKIWDDWLQLTQYFPNKDSEYYETAYVRYDVYDSQTEVYSGFGDTEVESRAMLLIDLLDKKVLTLSDLNLN